MQRYWHTARRLLADEQGVEAVEFVGLFPLVLLMLAIAWQFLVVGYTGLLSSGAAREGARAAATHEDVGRAVQNASPGYDGRRQWVGVAGYPCSGNGPVTVEVRLEIPHVIFPFFGALNGYPEITSRATVRCEPEPEA